jgi:hypothetical protein
MNGTRWARVMRWTVVQCQSVIVVDPVTNCYSLRLSNDFKAVVEVLF